MARYLAIKNVSICVDWVATREIHYRYEQCEWGWKESVKREELYDEDACYLLALDPRGDLLAFSHFRFDLDYGRPVLYWYVCYF
jgi:hypothetical protein